MSVREVREALMDFRRLAYTSVMTVMNIMVDKGYLRRAKQGGWYVYRARVKQEATTRRILRDMVNRVFNGSATAAMVNLLESSDMDAEELDELRGFIARKTNEESS